MLNKNKQNKISQKQKCLHRLATDLLNIKFHQKLDCPKPRHTKHLAIKRVKNNSSNKPEFQIGTLGSARTATSVCNSISTSLFRNCRFTLQIRSFPFSISNYPIHFHCLITKIGQTIRDDFLLRSPN